MIDTPNAVAVTSSEIVGHLWRRRGILVVVPILVALIVYGILKWNGSSYESHALIMIRMPASALRDGPRMQDLSPPAYADFLTSDEILYNVIQKVRDEKLKDFGGKFEDLQKNFKVKTLLTRETVSSAEYAPVLALTATGKSPEIAHRLATVWVDLAVSRFGSLRANEAGAIYSVFTEKFNSLMEDSSSLQEKEARLERQLTDLDTIIGVKSRILAGTTGNKIVLEGSKSDGATSAVSRYEDFGLIHERALLEVDLAEQETAAAPNRSVAIRARMDKIDQIVPRVLAEIDELGTKRVSIAKELETTHEQMLSSKGKLDQTRLVVSGASSDATLITDPKDTNSKGDFSLLARPVQPEKSSGPSRMLLGMAAGIAVGALLLLIFFVEVYVKRAIAEEA